MRSKALLVASSAAALGVSFPALGVDVVDQLAHSNGGLASSAQPGAYADQRIADDFTLSTSTAVTGVKWIGGSENFIAPDLANFTDFVIEIFADSGGTPGASIFSTTVAKNDTNPVQVGVDGVSGADLFRFTTTFASPINMNSGSYFVSIGAIYVSLLDDGFVWSHTSASANNAIAAQIPVGNGWSPFSGFGDMAFAITATPTPGGLVLLGLAGLIGSSRRRRN